MGVRSILSRLAATAPVPVFAVVGGGADEAMAKLRCDPKVELVATPRHASVLLVAGAFPPGEIRALAQVHDLLPVPRLTVRLGGERPAEFDGAVLLGDDVEALASSLVGLAHELHVGLRPSEPAILPDVDAVEWRGVGPYGHGGKGMTGGTPYGRPLAERGSDRDGLALDRLPVTLGPWSGVVPSGLELSLALKGDLIVEAQLGPVSIASGPHTIFERAIEEAVPIRDLEVARARHHLRWLGDALGVHGLAALGARASSLSGRITPESRGEAEQLFRYITRSGLLRFVLDAVGEVGEDGTEGLGPVARAAGNEDDARIDDLGYRRVGFRPLVQHRGDAAARWRQRMGEVLQSLDLAVAAGDGVGFGSGLVEGPRGRLTLDRRRVSAVGLVAGLLEGREWGDGVAAVWSLDLDPAVGLDDVGAQVGTAA